MVRAVPWDRTPSEMQSKWIKIQTVVEGKCVLQLRWSILLLPSNRLHRTVFA